MADLLSNARVDSLHCDITPHIKHGSDDKDIMRSRGLITRKSSICPARLKGIAESVISG